MSIFEWITDPKNATTLNTLLVASGLGLSFFVAKGIALIKTPLIFLFNQMFAVMELNDTNWYSRYTYDKFQLWLSKRDLYLNTTLTPNYDISRDDIKTNKLTKPGSGFYIFWYKKRLFVVITTFKDKEFGLNSYTNIYKIGRNKKIFDNITKEALGIDNSLINVFSLGGGEDNPEWGLVTKLTKRNAESVITNDDIKETLQASYDKFFANEEKYKSIGITWKHSLLLYGIPGTGKSSIIRMLATIMNCDIYMVDTNSISDKQFILGVGKLPANGLLVLEDVDSNQNFLDRTLNLPKKAVSVDGKPVLSLDGLLNVMDGCLTPDGIKIILTTNRLEKLDTAVYRPGRIDLPLEIEGLNNEAIENFIKFYYKQTYYVSTPILIPGSTLSNIWLNHQDSFKDFITEVENKFGKLH